MEWRRQSSVSCAHAFTEAQRWIEVRAFQKLLHNFFVVVCFLRCFLKQLAIQVQFFFFLPAVEVIGRIYDTEHPGIRDFSSLVAI